MSNTQPTEPLPPRQEPPTPPGPPYGGQAPVAMPGEPFYKRHGLAFAISTLVLSIVVLLGIVTAGAFAVASVVSHVGERVISRTFPQQPGVPGMPGMQQLHDFRAGTACRGDDTPGPDRNRGVAADPVQGGPAMPG